MTSKNNNNSLILKKFIIMYMLKHLHINILKVATALFLAVPSLANFQKDCYDLNEELIANVKKNLNEYEVIEDFLPIEECKVNKKGEIEELYLVNRRLDESVVKKVLSIKSIVKLTYFVNDQYGEAIYGKFPSMISQLPKLEDLTLKYNLQTFYEKGICPFTEKTIDPVCIVGKKLKTLTLDHIELDESMMSELNEVNLETLNIISGDTYYGKNKHYDYYIELKKLDGIIPNITLDGLTISDPIEHKYSGKCRWLNQSLKRNVKKYLRNHEDLRDFSPLRECKLNILGQIKEMYLISERNDQATIEKAISQKSLTKLTYVLDNNYYLRDPAVFNDFPSNLGKVSSKLEELTLKYNIQGFDKGLTMYYERKINPSLLDIKSENLKVLTLDHIEITDELVEKIGTTLKNLNKIIIISGEDYTGENHHQRNFNKFHDFQSKYKLKNLEELVIDNEVFVIEKAEE
ncbi:hypothetical protein BCR32DRAFT_251025 [Anaeromyces robustus]|uniref:RNI-like protein n=1 Tax=Anaeromyces robustus TaxID=1754192 RepID=A0A1Y1VTJ8_9FUNG|nr:hypothetical protein BCR32DRAFT_251025 [Anaeromyces robustus]|eukprot:ORX64608.1 hypothetical protein BCR32DRAFT_251025 [Anaeromyces robustus]